MAISTDVRPFRAGRAAGYVGAFFAGGLALSALYATTGFGLPCPFRAITGWDCPLCGGTRMGSALLHGDVQAAFLYNPLALIGLLVLGLLGVLWAVEAAGGPAIRLPRSLADVVTAGTRWSVVGPRARRSRDLYDRAQHALRPQTWLWCSAARPKAIPSVR